MVEHRIQHRRLPNVDSTLLNRIELKYDYTPLPHHGTNVYKSNPVSVVNCSVSCCCPLLATAGRAISSPYLIEPHDCLTFSVCFLFCYNSFFFSLFVFRYSAFNVSLPFITRFLFLLIAHIRF